MTKTCILAAFLSLLCISCACTGSRKQSGSETSRTVPQETSPFRADSAYRHIEHQVSFGPRVPNTPSHTACADYLAATLRGYGHEVIEQHATLTAYDGTPLKARNIIARYRPEAQHRLLLFAHWDTRPMADYDPDPSRRSQPIPGANDGASGVGVLLEVARLLTAHPLSSVGIDIALFDAEDYGAPEGADYEGDSSLTWALGTQHWTRNPHVPGYRADFGILLDMVGAQGARFYREYFSQQHAGKETSLIWSTAHRLGYHDYFLNEMGSAVTDDHYFVIRHLGIPCVDIIHHDPKSDKGFGHYWHTHADDLPSIDTATLTAVGETLWQVIVDYDHKLSQP